MSCCSHAESCAIKNAVTREENRCTIIGAAGRDCAGSSGTYGVDENAKFVHGPKHLSRESSSM